MTYDGRYDEYYLGMVTGLGYATIMLGLMVAKLDLATDVSSLVLGGVLSVIGGIIIIASIASIIARAKSHWAPQVKLVNSYPEGMEKEQL